MSVDLEEQYDKIYRYCYMKLGHRQAAEDVTQETFLRFLENYTYREMGKQMAYLYTIARNRCMDHYRKKQCVPLMEEPGETEDMEERLVQNHALKEAVQKLSEEEQELIFLRYGNELPVNQISKITGISRFAVHRRLKQSLEKLRELLGKENAF